MKEAACPKSEKITPLIFRCAAKCCLGIASILDHVWGGGIAR